MSLSRFPNGVAYQIPGKDATTFASGDTTPDVSNGSVFHANVANGAVAITSFDNVEVGQPLYIYAASAGVVTLTRNATILITSSAGSLVMGSNQCVQFIGIAKGVAAEVAPVA